MAGRNRVCSGTDVVFVIWCHVGWPDTFLKLDPNDALVSGDIQSGHRVVLEHADGVLSSWRHRLYRLIYPVTYRLPTNRAVNSAVGLSRAIHASDEDSAAAVPESR